MVGGVLPALIGFGLKDAVVPGGTPLASSVTLCAEPVVTVVEIVAVVLPPWAAETLLGLALIEKSEAVAPQAAGGALVAVRSVARSPLPLPAALPICPR